MGALIFFTHGRGLGFGFRAKHQSVPFSGKASRKTAMVAMLQPASCWPCGSTVGLTSSSHSQSTGGTETSRRNLNFFCRSNDSNWHSELPDEPWNARRERCCCVALASRRASSPCTAWEKDFSRKRACMSWEQSASTQGRRNVVVRAAQGEGETSGTRLGRIIKNKQRILDSKLRSMPEGELESRLSGMQAATKPYSLLDTMAQEILEGRTAIVVEAARLSPAESPESLAQRCVKYIEWGASALAVCTDEERSPNGLADLTAVCQAVTVPVLRRDWIIHPLQIAETREAGAAALTAVYTVLSKGLPLILNYTVSLGLNAVVEVINLKELQEVTTLGIPIYGFNLSVGLSLSMPSIRQDVSKALIGEIPFGAASMVGVYSVDEARVMKAAGADAVYVRHEVLQGQHATEKDSEAFLKLLSYSMSGDD